MMSFLSSLVGYALIPLAHAQRLQTAGGNAPGVRSMWSQITNVLQTSTPFAGGGNNGLIMALTSAIINFLFPLVSVVAVCMVIYAGMLIAMDAGNEEKLGEAKKIIMYAAAGVALSLITSYAIAFVQYYFSLILQ